jgi:ABC-type phosphate transport system permease subunit
MDTEGVQLTRSRTVFIVVTPMAEAGSMESLVISTARVTSCELNFI